MAYDEGLAQRIIETLDDQDNVVEKKMFGGVCWMLQGNLACGVHTDQLIVRVGPDSYEAALAKPNTRVFDLTKRPMKGWITVNSDGYESDEQLRDWVQQGVDFALSLPAK